MSTPRSEHEQERDKYLPPIFWPLEPKTDSERAADALEKIEKRLDDLERKDK